MCRTQKIKRIVEFYHAATRKNLDASAVLALKEASDPIIDKLFCFWYGKCHALAIRHNVAA